MSDFPACDAALAQAQQYDRDHHNPVWNYCSTLHCDDNVSYNHQFCYCEGQFSGPTYVRPNPYPPPPTFCINGIGTLIPISASKCYCCCSCFAFDTPIAVSKDTVKAVQHFAINDLVWVAEDASLKSWVQKPVLFSSGTGADGENRLIKIHFGDQTKGITLTPDSFVSQFVSKELSEKYYKILSTAPNNFIGKDGLVNLMKVRSVDADEIARLLSAPAIVAERIFNILKSDSKYLLVTATQPFLMKDKTLKQAGKLVPGKDVLVLENGSTTPIVSLELGMFHKGVHHIATSATPAKSVDGHLLVANGIVVGDYSTQLGLDSKNTDLKDVYKDHPSFGAKAYSEKYTHLKSTPFSAYAVEPATQSVKLFETYRVDKSALIPRDAFSFITKAQAEELLYDAPIFPASNNAVEPGVLYLFRLFRSFYPDVSFYYDQNNMFPNAYSFKQYGGKFVVINGGWTLVEGLYFDGIAMTIAHMVAVLCNEGSLPPDVSPTGEADYDVYPLFLSLFFNAQAAMLSYNAALGQIKKVFEYIKHHRKPPHEISLDCRIDVLEASINGLPLPHCAGGPPNPALEVVSVSATVPEGSEKPVVSVIFNMPVDPVTAIALGNYFFDPGMLVFGASVDEGNPAKVDIVADVQPDIDYYLAVTGVLSINKQPVIIGKNGGKFKLS